MQIIDVAVDQICAIVPVGLTTEQIDKIKEVFHHYNSVLVADFNNYLMEEF